MIRAGANQEGIIDTYLNPDTHNGHRHLMVGPYLVYTVYGWGDELSKLLLQTASIH